MENQLFRFINTLYGNYYPAYYTMYRLYKAWSDRRERSFLKHWIQPGMVVVDVGANIGIYTRFFANLTGESGHVHAFEPAALNFRHLRANISTFKNISIRQVAVGEMQGTIKLYVSDILNVDHRTFDSADGRNSIDVPVISLDEYFLTGQRVDFIKIDVQGYEYNVLRGAKRVLEENREIKMLIEFWPYGLKKAGASHNMLIDLISSFGFELTDCTGNVLNPTSLNFNCKDHYVNLFVTRRL